MYDWLANASEISVLHATEKVVNLITDQEELISIVTSAIGDGPHNIVVPLERFDPSPESGQRAVSAGNRLQINRFQIELESAATWNPRPDWPLIRKLNGRILKAAPHMRAALHAGTPDPGVHELLGRSLSQDANLEDHFVKALAQPASRLVTGFHQADREMSLTAALNLAGLGTGLTPAGDDFLAGAMMACWAGFSPRKTLEFLPAAAEGAGQRTTRLSAAYLRSAAQGEFDLVWHLLLQGLIEGDDRTWKRSLQEILRIGHNSGAYTLTGFVNIVAPAIG